MYIRCKEKTTSRQPAASEDLAEAVKQSGHARQPAAPEHTSGLAEAVKQNGQARQFLLADREVALEAVNQDGDAVHHAAPEARGRRPRQRKSRKRRAELAEATRKLEQCRGRLEATAIIQKAIGMVEAGRSGIHATWLGDCDDIELKTLAMFEEELQAWQTMRGWSCSRELAMSRHDS